MIIYYHVRLKMQSPKKTERHTTDLYFNGGVELAQCQQQQRPPAAHTHTHKIWAHILLYQMHTHIICTECGKQNAGNTLTSRSPARSRSLYPEGRKCQYCQLSHRCKNWKVLEQWTSKLSAKQPLRCLNVPVLVHL